MIGRPRDRLSNADAGHPVAAFVKKGANVRCLLLPGKGYRIKWLRIAATATATITSFSAEAVRRFGSNSLTATYNTAATKQITMFERLRTKASIIGGPSTRAEVFSSQA
jgi:hypothetical protein